MDLKMENSSFNVEIVTPKFNRIPYPNTLRAIEWRSKMKTLERNPNARFPVRVYKP